MDRGQGRKANLKGFILPTMKAGDNDEEQAHPPLGELFVAIFQSLRIKCRK